MQDDLFDAVTVFSSEMNSLMFLKLELGGQVPPALWEPGRFACLFPLGSVPRWVNYRLRGCCVPNWGTALRRGSTDADTALISYESQAKYNAFVSELLGCSVLPTLNNSLCRQRHVRS